MRAEQEIWERYYRELDHRHFENMEELEWVLYIGRDSTITPPETLQDIHSNATIYFELLVRWLTLNKSNSSSATNELIPELNARKNLLGSSLQNIKIVNNLK